MDEIPFDSNRKRLSVVVRYGDEHLLITKGEAESVFGICQTVMIDGVPQPFDKSRQAQAAATFQKLSADGYRTLGIAVAKVDKLEAYTLAAEHDLTLVGFAAFLDPPKEGVLLGSQCSQEERRLCGHYDRRQPVRDSEGRP